MRGKIGLVVGLGIGYVLGARAGRQRYHQIKKQWLKLWHLDPVQEKVELVKEFAKTQALAVPAAVWDGALKVAKSASGSGTPGQKLDSALAKGKEVAEDVADVVEDAVEDATKAAKRATTAKSTKSTKKKSTPKDS